MQITNLRREGNAASKLKATLAAVMIMVYIKAGDKTNILTFA